MIKHIGDVHVSVGSDYVGEVEINRSPNNFFDARLIADIADAYDELDARFCRAIVLCSAGKHFCAGADFHEESSAEALPSDGAGDLYRQAVRLFCAGLPVVAAIQGAAIGGGLGLACSADFRVGAPEARFSANFAKLGFHQGFGLSVTLPRIVGQQFALEMLYVGARITGTEAHARGLVDRLSPIDEVRTGARDLAREIAQSAPLAVRSIRTTMRGTLAAEVEIVTQHEDSEQVRLMSTHDFVEGSKASLERRDPNFVGK